MSQSTRLKYLEGSSKRTGHCVPGTPDGDIDIIRFCRDVLQVRLYPAQGTVLKVLTARVDLLTPFDIDLITQWTAGFFRVDDDKGSRFEGSGIPPDVLDRMSWCRAAGRWTFREATLVLGRRASKSYISSIMACFQLWRLLALDDPQQALGLQPRKKLLLPVFSTSRERAERDQFGDVLQMITSADAFKPFIGKVTSDQLSLFTPAQLRRASRSPVESGSIVVSALPTTSASGRGPAVITLVIDEAAFIDGSGSTSSADEVYRAATPALSQFRTEACTIMASSPWTQIGRFYEGYLEALDINPQTGLASQPDCIVIQLASDALYTGWKDAHTTPMWPEGPTFEKVTRPIFEFDDSLRRRQALDPDGFNVEYLGRWAASQSAYLSDRTVNAMFEPLGGQTLTFQVHPSAGITYVGHADPGVSGSNFAFVLGHSVQIDGLLHVVIDVIRTWRPQDYPDGRIRYDEVAASIYQLISTFRPETVSFDQFNSELMATELNDRARSDRLGCTVFVQAAGASEKWNRYEKMKTIASEGRLHIPLHKEARDEMRFLQRDGQRIHAPTSGPIQHDDVVDSLTWIVDHLIGPDAQIHKTLSDTRPQFTDAQLLFANFGRRTPLRGYIDPGSRPRWHPDRRR